MKLFQRDEMLVRTYGSCRKTAPCCKGFPLCADRACWRGARVERLPTVAERSVLPTPGLLRAATAGFRYCLC